MRNSFRSKIFGPNYRWWALGIVGLANFVATMDIGIINIGLPIIIAHFKGDMALAAWIALIYALVTAALYLPFGKLADLVGRKGVLGVGFLLYSLGSGLAAFSASPGQLIFFRSVQAAGCSMMTATTFALITALFPATERGRAMGISGGTISALGFTVGPVLGGFLAHVLGWRSIFYASGALGLVGFLAAHLILREEGRSTPWKKLSESFDIPGTLLFTLSLGSFMLALTAGQKGDWRSPIVTAEFLMALLSSLVFFFWEARTPHPLLDLRLFKIRPFAFGNVARLFCFSAATINSLLMPFFLQLALGLSPLQAGFLLTPNALGLAVVSPLSGFLSEKVSSRILSSLGLALTAFSFLTLGSLSATASFWDVGRALALLGAGLGLFQAPNNNSVMSSVPLNRLGVASSFIAIVRSLGQSMGAALGTTMVTASLAAVGKDVSLQTLRTGTSAHGSAALFAFVRGYQKAHRTGALLCAFGVVASLVRGRHREARPVH